MPANALAEDHLLTLNVLKAADLDSAILRSGQGTVVSDVLELLPHGQVFLQDVAISVGVRVGLAVVENRLGLFFRTPLHPRLHPPQHPSRSRAELVTFQSGLCLRRQGRYKAVSLRTIL